MVSPNQHYEPRSGTITFTNVADGLSERVTISQLQQDVLFADKDAVDIGFEGGDFQIAVGHNVEIDYTVDVAWIKKADTRAFYEETLTFIAEENYSEEERTGKISFSGKDANGNDLKTVILVKQAAPYLRVSMTDTTVYSRGEAFTLELESNFEPSVSLDADWIIFQGFVDSNPPLLRPLFKAEGNSGENDRIGTITFPSPYLQDPPTVTVRQKATENGLGFEMLGVYSFSGEDWVFSTGKDQILLSGSSASRTFTLFRPSDNRFFQVGGLVHPEEGNVINAKITQNMTPQTDAFFQTALSVVNTDGAFAKVTSDQGFTLVIKTR